MSTEITSILSRFHYPFPMLKNPFAQTLQEITEQH